jgi:8-hydroxy-5-deazaflavin:NADPH oxidoreductase
VIAKPEPVTILGAGAVGAAIAGALARTGHRVTIGVRHPRAAPVLELVAELGSGSCAATPDEAIRASRVVIAAIPGSSMHALIDAYAGELDGKIVIDATNDLSGGHGPEKLSSLPYLAQQAPAALGFRAFNSVGWENMANPRFGDAVADLFYAGPPTGDRAVVEALIADVGFRPQYAGEGPGAHRAVDSLATLWFALALGQRRGRRLAFRLLTDPDSEQAAS